MAAALALRTARARRVGVRALFIVVSNLLRCWSLHYITNARMGQRPFDERANRRSELRFTGMDGDGMY
jgi:hypothetical protein